jgi:hypothetical protein
MFPISGTFYFPERSCLVPPRKFEFPCCVYLKHSDATWFGFEHIWQTTRFLACSFICLGLYLVHCAAPCPFCWHNWHEISGIASPDPFQLQDFFTCPGALQLKHRVLSNFAGWHTGTCFIQKIYAPSSSLLQGKHLPFTPSPLRLNIFRLFVILSLTQLYRFSFRLPHLNINTGPPSDELDKNIQQKSHFLFFSQWNGYSHFRSVLNWFRN